MTPKITTCPFPMIFTSYLSPTNHRPSRVRAKSDTGKVVTVPWEPALNVQENHVAAVRALVEKHPGVWGEYDWEGNYSVSLEQCVFIGRYR